MTGDRENGFALPNDRAIAQFAPNFTVYLLPPDVVCLYSEDRKFLLHGELYCALAVAIGEGGRSFRDIIRELEQHFPAEPIREALKRLIERRYILTAPRALTPVAAAYWVSLGLSPETVEKNLQKCRVRIQAIEVDGASELEAALKELGVRVVKRTPDMTITLVNDYLEAELVEVNRQHLAEGTPWLLVQPSGIFPLVGPVLRPGSGACWTCIAERMKRNREIKALLDRRDAYCIAVSPLAQHSFGQSAIQLAALEIAKAIASDFRTDLNTNIVSLDLLGSTIVKHHVAARPQCPECGSKKLRDPRRAPTPIEIGKGGKGVMTSSGFRSVSPAATVARFRRHVSPLTGVVSRLERIQADVPLNTNYHATHNFSGPTESVHELRAGLSGGSYGKGSTAEQAEASALMEAIERYSGIFQGDEIRAKKRFIDFAPDEAIAPNDVLLYSEEQLERDRSPDAMEPEATPELFDPSAKIDWSPVWSLRDGRFKYLPTSILYFFYRGPASFGADSNGCAAGNTREEAIVQGFLELVERDAYAIWWYNRLQRPEVDLDQFDDSYIRALRKQLTQTGRRLWVLDLTNDLGIPTFIAITHWMQDGMENIEFGSGAHFDKRIALMRTLTELNQFLSLGFLGGGTGEKSSLDGINPLRLEEYPYLIPGGVPLVQPDLGAKFGHLDTHEQVAACVALTKEAGLDFLVLDQTRPDIEVPVVRVIVPHLRHFYRRFAQGRLYDVPVKLGLRDKPIQEQDLNPIFPHT
ncbi:TOMM precursor leader peptide-binding protein [Methyloferula stellata]|uniref:TOMM precursor leader peptide-binding protein n=1 Tax=Methyloferula stellata TaxID=876270 RepID=UPI00037299B2|nr:TOMM precursor leader peptide-binding protein [Methyloferula stellata]